MVGISLPYARLSRLKSALGIVVRFHMGRSHCLILFLGREELCLMVLVATLLQIKYKSVDGGLPDAARLRSGVYAGLPSTVQLLE